MAVETGIEWADATSNFWRGCHEVSSGCARCYALVWAHRYRFDGHVIVRAADKTFFAAESKKWAERRQLIEDTEHRRMRVFTCSLSDFFHPDADAWRDEAWAVIRRNPQYDWQILTKRPELIADRLPADWGDGWGHVWLGVSIETRQQIKRAEILCRTPAAVRFVSCEPLLGPLVATPLEDRDPRARPLGERCSVPRCDAKAVSVQGARLLCEGHTIDFDLNVIALDWVICGGESGPHARRIDKAWVRELRDRCQAERVAFLFKQWGGKHPKASGRELDGRVWDQFPASRAPGPDHPRDPHSFMASFSRRREVIAQ